MLRPEALYLQPEITLSPFPLVPKAKQMGQFPIPRAYPACDLHTLQFCSQVCLRFIKIY